MDRKNLRRASSLAVLCFISLFMVTRTEGFDNIRTVQFLLIFISGALLGLAIGIVRSSRGIQKEA